MDDEIKGWLRKIESVKGGDVDLSRDEDLSIALMNLISLEEHLYFTAMKTDNAKYLEMLNSVREVRKKFLKKIVVNPVGEEWCISKHLLAASMRLMEVGTKELAKDNKEDSNAAFRAAFDLYSLFFAINMKMVGMAELKESKDSASGKSSVMGRVSAIIKKVVDCCKE
jgi:hypothetical protein